MKYLKLFEKFYNPPLDVKDKLDKIVQSLLSKYGGKEFFHKLDDSIKDITNKDITISLLRGNENEWVCSSGGFGDKVFDLYEQGEFKCKGIVVFNGKMLTKNKGVTNWYPDNFDMDNKEFIYVDDSLFSGSTANKVDDFLKSNHNSKIKSISVIYDGSKDKNPMVKSFFRYYQ